MRTGWRAHFGARCYRHESLPGTDAAGGKTPAIRKLQRPLVYIFTYDEEVAAQGSARLLKVLPEVFQGYPLPTVTLIGEPTDFAVFPAHKAMPRSIFMYVAKEDIVAHPIKD